VIGSWLAKQKRDDIVLATKARFPMGDKPNQRGLGRKHLIAACEASLDRLGTDYIDLYQVHMWDYATPIEETLRALDDLVRAGKVRYLGLSNFAAWQIMKALGLQRAGGLSPFVSIQPLYNLLDRELEWEIVPLALSEGLGIIPWSPLRGGWLSGKFRRGMAKPLEGSRVEKAEAEGWSENWSDYANERTFATLDALHEIAGETGAPPAAIAIAWLLSRPGVTAPILGARSLGQLEASLAGAGLSLGEAQLARLDKASAMRLPYPMSFHAAQGGR
jgi:aryl-alcohol dehydrogenase-like predicted oxidoreductase